ncbi:hypothetical protein ACFVMA_13920 [Streptomyces rochei]|uniref:hypothetical protein n=1 Tax=Streptomyces rochei TaxID=1928 RepID=UPI0036AE9B0E
MSDVDPQAVMLYPQEDGKLVEIPEEHAAVLALYRDRMPLVFEVQEYGPPMFYPLIDVDEEPYGAPRPGELETEARRVAAYLKGQRLGDGPPPPDFRRLANAAIRAHVADIASFTAGCAHDEPPARVRRYVEQETRRVGKQLSRTVEAAVREAQDQDLTATA